MYLLKCCDQPPTRIGLFTYHNRTRHQKITESFEIIKEKVHIYWSYASVGYRAHIQGVIA